MSKKIGIILALVILWLGFAPLAYGETGSIFRLGKDVVIQKEDRVKHVLSFGGQVTISGQVEGSVLCLFESVVLTESALVEGDVLSLGGVVVRGRDSVVKGQVHEINLSELSDAVSIILNEEWEGWSWIFAFVSMFFLLCLLVLGMITFAVIPKQMKVIAAAIRTNPWRASCWGLVGLISIIPLAVLLTMSVVGIVLVPLEMTIAMTASVLGFIAVAQLVGQVTLVLLKRPDRGVMTQTSLGLAIIWLVGWIPYVGWMIKALVIVVGLGGVLVTRFGTVRD